jgi:bleomycin hydrolase
MKNLKMFFMLMAMVAIIPVYAQIENKSDAPEGYRFTEEIRLAATPARNQFRSSTCWSFGTVSLIESELLRMGKGQHDLSEMFVVRHVYAEKADRYVRRHGAAGFAAGGALPDAFYVLANWGMVPEEAYTGKVIGEENHVHGEIDEVLKAFVDAIIKNPNRKLTPKWKEAFNGLLDAYLGDYPKEFTIGGKKYTPVTYGASLGIKQEDYVQLTSFTHKPYYQPFILEIPDNWDHEKSYNLPLDEMMEVIDNALANGYTVVWASDISEKGFSHRNGVAIVPDVQVQEVAGMERARWEQMSQREKDELLYSFKAPVKEKVITSEERQKGYDDYSTTDDHAMHIIGTAKDQNGTKYYIVKNSWGTDNNPYEGHLYVSESYVRYKTVSLMLHKDGIPRKTKSKLGI